MVTRALVLGGADCVWRDMIAAERLCDWDVIVACNDVGAEFQGHLDHWCTLHPEKFAIWKRQRDANGLPPADHVWFHRNGSTHEMRAAGLTRVESTPDWGGSSGLLAVQIALMHADLVVCCGVPMSTERSHFFDEKPWQAAVKYRRAWQSRLDEIAGRVRSMNGWTRDLLGEPDKRWLRVRKRSAARTRIREESTSGAQGST